jgi:hypothetical protein
MDNLPFQAKVLWRLYVTCKENKCKFAVSIFATGTGESDTTTTLFLQVVEHIL